MFRNKKTCLYMERKCDEFKENIHATRPQHAPLPVEESTFMIDQEIVVNTMALMVFRMYSGMECTVWFVYEEYRSRECSFKNTYTKNKIPITQKKM